MHSKEKWTCQAVLLMLMGMICSIALVKTPPSVYEIVRDVPQVPVPRESGLGGVAALGAGTAEEPETTAAYTGERPAWVNSFRKLNVRRSPDLDGEILGFFVYRQEILVDGTEQNGFYQAVGTDSYTGETVSGYCFGSYLTFEAPGPPQVQLDVPAYFQADPRWAEKTIGSTKKTMGAIGCTTTCMAMSKSYLTQTEVLPDAMADLLWYDTNGEMGWPATYTWVADETNYLEMVFGQLHEGIPVLIGAERHNGSPHWVLITGYQGDAREFVPADFIINDPLTSQRTTLEQFLDEYPVFEKIAYYTG